jgi:ribosomal protein S12 methylthiotransferase accessory factor
MSEAERLLVDGRTGVVSTLTDFPVAPNAPSVFLSGATLPRTLVFSSAPAPRLNSAAGLTSDAARAAALGEAVERYCGTQYGWREMRIATYEELRIAGIRAVSPAEMPLAHPSQHEPGGGLERVSPFTPTTRLRWVSGYEVRTGRPIEIPACRIYMGYRTSDPEESQIDWAVSTGQSCHFDPATAMLGGLLEVVERDSFMITWLHRLGRHRIDPGSGPQLGPIFRQRFRRQGLEYRLFDITSDLGIPTVLAVLLSPHPFEPRAARSVSLGAAAHPNPERAAIKALLETAQSLPFLRTVLRAPRRSLREAADFRDFDDHVALYADGERTEALAFLLDGEETVGIESLPSFGSGSPTEDLHACMGRLDGAGLKAIASEITTPDVRCSGLHVFKVLVPGAVELKTQRTLFLGPQRLYDAPRRMGWPDVATHPRDLNPDPHPFP